MIDIKNINAILKAAAVEAIDAISYGRSGIDFASPSAVSSGSAGSDAGVVCIAISVEVPVNLKFSLKATRGLMISIAAAALETAENKIGADEYMDTGAEILNIAAGTCTKKILTGNFSLKLGLPEKNKDWSESGLNILTQCRFARDADDYIIFTIYAP